LLSSSDGVGEKKEREEERVLGLTPRSLICVKKKKKKGKWPGEGNSQHFVLSGGRVHVRILATRKSSGIPLGEKKEDGYPFIPRVGERRKEKKKKKKGEEKKKVRRYQSKQDRRVAHDEKRSTKPKIGRGYCFIAAFLDIGGRKEKGGRAPSFHALSEGRRKVSLKGKRLTLFVPIDLTRGKERKNRSVDFRFLPQEAKRKKKKKFRTLKKKRRECPWRP